MYRITFLSGKLKGRRLTVHHGTVRFGRAPDCSIRLSDPSVADRHAEIEERDGHIYARNLDPVHAASVRGERLGPAERELRPDEELLVGKVRLKVETVEFRRAPPHRHLNSVQIIAYSALVMVVLLEFALLLQFVYMNEAPVAGAPGAPVNAGPETPGTGEVAAVQAPAIAPAPAPVPAAAPEVRPGAPPLEIVAPDFDAVPIPPRRTP